MRVLSWSDALVWASKCRASQTHWRVLGTGHRTCLAETGTKAKGWDEGQAETQACRSATDVTLASFSFLILLSYFPFTSFVPPPILSPSFSRFCFTIFRSFIFHAHATLCLVNFFSYLRFYFDALIPVTSPSHSFLPSYFSQSPTPLFSKLVPTPPSLSLFWLPVFLLSRQLRAGECRALRSGSAQGGWALRSLGLHLASLGQTRAQEGATTPGRRTESEREAPPAPPAPPVASRPFEVASRAGMQPGYQSPSWIPKVSA